MLYRHHGFGAHAVGMLGGHGGHARQSLVLAVLFLAALIVAVLGRYITVQHMEERFGDVRRAATAGWVVFLAVLLVAALIALRYV